MSKTTPGTLFLTKAGLAFELHPYAYDPDAPRVGLQAAQALDVDPAQTFKTLMAEADGKPVCVVVPSPDLYQCRPAWASAVDFTRRCGARAQCGVRRLDGLKPHPA